MVSPYLLWCLSWFSLLVMVLCSAGVVSAQVAVSANDGHTTFGKSGMVGGHGPFPDEVVIIDLGPSPPRIVATIIAPTSVVGPPTSVAVSRDASFAVVSSSTKFDADAPAQLAPNDQLSVIDLTNPRPVVVQTQLAGLGAAALRLNPANNLLLVSNRFEGTVSVFTVANRRLKPSGKVFIDPGCQPAGIDFTSDGRAALVACRLENKVMVLRIDGSAVTLDSRPITTGVSPYSVRINPAGTLAAVGNVGRGDGDVDTVSLIDLTTEPFRAVESVAVGRGPEGLRWSPDGRLLALDTQEGTTKPLGSPFRGESGRLQLYGLRGHQLQLVAAAPLGHWSHGIVFSRDGRRIFVQNMIEKTIQVFAWDGHSLRAEESLFLDAGPAAIDTAWQ